MRPGILVPGGTVAPPAPRAAMPNLRDAQAVADLFVGVFRRDLGLFYPQAGLQADPIEPGRHESASGPDFRLTEDGGVGVRVDLFGVRYRLQARGSGPFSPHDLRMVRAIGAVLNLRYQHLIPDHALDAAGTLPGRVGRPLRRRVHRALGLHGHRRPARAGSPRPSTRSGPPRSRPTRTAGSPPAPSCSATMTRPSPRIQPRRPMRCLTGSS